MGSFTCDRQDPVMARGIQFPDQGSNPHPLPWECRVPATGLSGKAPSNLLLILISWPLPMNHQSVQSLSCVHYVRFTMNHKCLLNVASVIANPFQKVFNLLCPDLSEELLWQPEPYKMHFLKNKTWKSNYSLTHGLQTECCEHEFHCKSPSELLDNQVHCLWRVIFWKLFFFREVLNSELNNKPCCKQICCHPGFVVPFIEPR